MYYSFNFAASVTRVCMEEIRLRGKKKRKTSKLEQIHNEKKNGEKVIKSMNISY
jgi:hypothetical protein